MKQDEHGRWVRAEPQQLGPNRSFGGYYRSPDRMVDGKLLRGVPLKTAEDAVVAAVQMGYRVVDEQIERGMRAAQRLRGAAERSGHSGDPGKMLDAGERLANNAAMTGLQWLESMSGDPGSLVQRLLAAEYRMLGDFLGLQKDHGRNAFRKARHAHDGAASSADHPDERPGTRAQASSGFEPQRVPRVRVMHEPGSARRAVTLRTWEVAREALDTELELVFFLLDASTPHKLAPARVSQEGDSPVLRLATHEDDPAGRWRAAVCSLQGEQLGLIEIEL
ncbi:hypothetical protein QTH91_15800 [Variovorax dokdonensis]|uniref:Uncharacterized protein n=1 Tax=Variovorax dokdonensis TaxID=344883 RepID=A0ABT7NDG0_9BURK|nr:hypothetical protein [Variovorax dokdonensis]MDM0045952.1 hypothetical protein [Variovorax dokdonensis]